MEHSSDAVYARRWWILSVLCLSLVLVVVGNSSLNIALPSMARDLDASDSQLQWIVDAYAIVFAGLLLPAGALGDRFGRKGALQLGLTVFGIGTLAATLADSPNQVIACRAFMGIGAAFVMPGTLSILATVFPPAERPKAIAIWAGFAGAGGAFGILMSGVLLDHFWWGSVFFVNIPVIALALVAGAILLPTSKDPGHTPLDFPGAALSIAGLASLVYSIIEAPTKGWTSGRTVGVFLLAVVLLTAFVWWERHTPRPMLDLSMFANPRFTTGCVTIFLGFMAMFGMFLIMTLYMQSARGWGPLGTGVRLLPFPVAMMISAPRSAGFTERYGPRRVITAGLALIFVGFVLASQLDTHSSYLLLLASAVFMGVGMGQTMPPSTSAIMSSLPMHKAGVGSAVNDTTREVGGALGIAILGSLTSWRYKATLPDGAPDEIRRGIEHAAAAAGQIGGADGQALLTQAREAFVNGLEAAYLVGAALAVLTAVVVNVLLRRREDDTLGDEPAVVPTAFAPDGADGADGAASAASAAHSRAAGPGAPTAPAGVVSPAEASEAT
jgi:EmrB/QacA subfamily drug resistance transporter